MTSKKKTMTLDSADLIKRGEEAMKGLAENFDAWMNDELTRLLDARRVVLEEGVTEMALEALHVVAHDMKGSSSTYGYPLAARVAATLSTLTEKVVEEEPSLDLINAHVDAIRAIIQGGIKEADNPVGMEIADNLQDIVESRTAEAG